jgi:hypothetical protein
MVLPSLSPLSNRTSKSVEVPPPPHFQPTVGMIRNAKIELNVLTRSSGEELTDAQKLGLHYEARVQQHLSKVWPLYVCSPKLRFYDDRGPRVAIPDGILWNHNPVVIVEIKFQHVPDAWWQLKRLYQPVLEAIVPKESRIKCLEIVKSYDPATPFPCEVELVEHLEKWVEDPLDSFGVFRWTK